MKLRSLVVCEELGNAWWDVAVALIAAGDLS